VPEGPAPVADAVPVRSVALRLAALEPAGPLAVLPSIAEDAGLLREAVGVPEGPRALLHPVPVRAVEEPPAVGVEAEPAPVRTAVGEGALGLDPSVVVPREVGAVAAPRPVAPAPLLPPARRVGCRPLGPGRAGALLRAPAQPDPLAAGPEQEGPEG